MAALIFGGVMERYPNIRCWTAHAGWLRAVPVRPGSITATSGGPSRRSIIDQKPSSYLDAFKFDIIAHSKPALDYLVQTFGADQVYLGTDYPFDMGLPDPVGTIEAIETTYVAGKTLIKEGTPGPLCGCELSGSGESRGLPPDVIGVLLVLAGMQWRGWRWPEYADHGGFER